MTNTCFMRPFSELSVPRIGRPLPSRAPQRLTARLPNPYRATPDAKNYIPRGEIRCNGNDTLLSYPCSGARGRTSPAFIRERRAAPSGRAGKGEIQDERLGPKCLILSCGVVIKLFGVVFGVGSCGVTYEKERQAKSHTPPPGQSVRVPVRTISRFQSPIRALLAHYTVGYRPLIQISRALPIRVTHDPRETAGLFPDERSFSCEHRIDDLQHLPGYCYPGGLPPFIVPPPKLVSQPNSFVPGPPWPPAQAAYTPGSCEVLFRCIPSSIFL